MGHGLPSPSPSARPPGRENPDPFGPPPGTGNRREPTPSLIDAVGRAQSQVWAERLKTWSKIFGVFLSGGAVVYQIASTRLQMQMDATVEEHEEQALEEVHSDANMRLKVAERKIVTLEDKVHTLDSISADTTAKTKECHEALFELYRRLAGKTAAAKVRSRRGKIRAAARARRRFEDYAAEGQSLDRAFLRAVESIH